MPRVRRGTLVKKRHKKIIERAQGYYGAKHRLFRSAHEQVLKSGNYAYRDRRARKRDFRRLWITRINAAARFHGMPYNRFMEGLRKANVAVDRKALADLAVNDAQAFEALVRKALAALEAASA